MDELTAGPPWPNYFRWNRALADYRLGARSAYRPVYLDVGQELVSELASAVQVTGDPVEAFVSDVTATLRLEATGSRDIFGLHEAWLQYWEREEARLPEPPCVALLGLFSLAAQRMHSDDKWSRNNFYVRLCELLRVRDAQTRKLLESQFRSRSPLLWSALNSWLEAGGGIRGIPTAQVEPHRYVDLPISQVFLREGDRERLLEVFAEIGLAGGERLSSSEMEQLLADSGLGIGVRLQRLWRNEEARIRICEIAALELLAWRGTTQAKLGQRNVPLWLSAVLRTSILPSLELACCAPASGSPGQRACAVFARPGDTETRQAFPQGGLQLCLSDNGEWLIPGSRDEVAVAELLQTAIHLEGANLMLRRALRRVVPLAYQEEVRLYIETPRVELGRNYLVLCHESIAATVEAQLEHCACPGFSTRLPGQLRGLPNRWVLFTDVTVMRRVMSSAPDLNSLEALGHAQIAASGGFPLPVRNHWHISSPPVLRAATDDEQPSEIVVSQTHKDGRSIEVLRRRGQGSYFIQLAGALPPSPGSYLAVLNSADRRVASASFHLVSSDAPLGSASTDHIDLGWLLENTPLHAQDVTMRAGVVLRGARCPRAPQGSRLSGGPVVLGGAVERGQADEYAWDLDATPPSAAVPAPACLSSEGAHVFVCPPALGHSVRREGRCKHCSLERQFPRLRQAVSRDGRRGAPRQVSSGASSAPGSSKTEVSRALRALPPLMVSNGVASLDDLVDALSLLESGRWSQFVALAGQFSDAPWYPTELAAALSASAILEVSGDQGSGTSWQVAPASIVRTTRGEPFLTGHRCRGFLRALDSIVRGHGGWVDTVGQSGAPSAIVVKVTNGSLKAIAEEMVEAGHELTLQEDPAESILAWLPSLTTTAAQLRTVDLPLRFQRAERFIAREGGWTAVTSISVPGAYRIRTAGPTLHLFASEQALVAGRARLGPYRLVKHLGAALEGTSLVAYDSSTEVLTTPLGAQLFGLLERAAVLCSGRDPQRRGGLVEYSGVGSEVATGIARVLACSTDELRNLDG